MDRLLHTAQDDRAPENHTEDQMILSEGAVVDIVKVEQLSGYRLKLHFSDGMARVVDFEPFLRRTRNPLIRSYLEPKKFMNYRLEYGELVWDEYGLCFPIADLYENRL